MKLRKCKRQSVFFVKLKEIYAAVPAEQQVSFMEYIVLAGVFLNGRQIKSSS